LRLISLSLRLKDLLGPVTRAASAPGSAPTQTSISEQLLRRNVNRFRGGLVFKARRRVHHSTLGWRVIKKKKKNTRMQEATMAVKCAVVPRRARI